MEEREKLEKMDLIRSRFSVSYARAHEVLEACGWDAVQATLRLEADKSRRRDVVEEIRVRGNDLVDTVKRLLHEGNIKRIVVKDDSGQELLNLPVTGFIALTALLPILTAIGAIVVVTMDYTVQVERQD